MGLLMGLREGTFCLRPMNSLGIWWKVRYLMGVFSRPAIGGLFSFKGSRNDAKGRSGREVQGLSRIPLAIRLMPSFMSSAPKLRSRPRRLSASFKYVKSCL